MFFIDELTRVASGRAWRSARQAAQRAIHPLPMSRVMRAIDPARLGEIQQRYGNAAERVHWPKYADVERWLPLNIRRAQDLGLTRTRGESLDILDLGSGGGFFLLVAKVCGHRGLGIDLDDVPLYHELFELFGLKRVVSRIDAFQPLPEGAAAYGRFDLVTAFSICFNGQKTPQLWGPNEWEFLLEDLRSRFLKPGGRVYLDFNPENDGSFFSAELRSFFLDRGADIDRSKVLLQM